MPEGWEEGEMRSKTRGQICGAVGGARARGEEAAAAPVCPKRDGWRGDAGEDGERWICWGCVWAWRRRRGRT